jgi:hypothetical protein
MPRYVKIAWEESCALVFLATLFSLKTITNKKVLQTKRAQESCGWQSVGSMEQKCLSLSSLLKVNRSFK